MDTFGMFIGMMLGTLMDPIRTPGYFISGWFIKNFAGALVASFIWNVVIYALIIQPRERKDLFELRLDVFFASCAGGLLLTSITFFFAARRRKRQLAGTIAKTECKEQKPEA